jgi:maltooligosyltrehalose trehalohydrolase
VKPVRYDTFGAQLLEPGLTRFRLWAPTAKSVELLIEGREPRRIEPDADGWCDATINCGAGTEYRYRIDGELVVPDPASRQQHDDIESPSVVVDSRYAWQHAHWRGRPWHETVLYELHIGLLGGFDGVRRRLRELAELGITAIELMPVAEFPGRRGWGYDGVLPYAPDSSYGTPDQLKQLIDEAHGLGLMVFLDVVYNHFGPTGNYLHGYAKSFFREDAPTPWGAAIDFRQQPVRDFFIENALYWLHEFRFDGLRFDAVHAIVGDELLRELGERVRASRGDRHIHLVLENDDNRADWLQGNFDAQWNDDFHHVMHVLLTGEREGYYADYADKPIERLARCLSEGFAYQGESSPHRHGARRGQPSASLPPTAFVNFLQNHDQTGNRPLGDRLTTLADARTLEVAQAVLLLSPPVPMLFMGEETGAREPFLYFTDHDEQLAALVRDGRRREFASFPGFSNEAMRTLIPDPNAQSTFDASWPSLTTDHPDAKATHDRIRELLAMRRKHLMPFLDGARSIGASAIGDNAVRAEWRLADGSTWTIAANFGTDDVSLSGTDGTPTYATDAFASKAAAGGTLVGRSFVLWHPERPT